mmetsp:Transcript_31680/g.67325  ORF Transcript_31680/g.67325 Transcript_31680/m.67325 type:complete len:211 (+) Transcript_31680:287-919(+)
MGCSPTRHCCRPWVSRCHRLRARASMRVCHRSRARGWAPLSRLGRIPRRRLRPGQASTATRTTRMSSIAEETTTRQSMIARRPNSTTARRLLRRSRSHRPRRSSTARPRGHHRLMATTPATAATPATAGNCSRSPCRRCRRGRHTARRTGTAVLRSLWRRLERPTGRGAPMPSSSSSRSGIAICSQTRRLWRSSRRFSAMAWTSRRLRAS